MDGRMSVDGSFAGTGPQGELEPEVRGEAAPGHRLSPQTLLGARHDKAWVPPAGFATPAHMAQQAALTDLVRNPAPIPGRHYWVRARSRERVLPGTFDASGNWLLAATNGWCPPSDVLAWWGPLDLPPALAGV